MAIDLREVRDDVIGHLKLGYETMRDLPPHDYLLVGGVALVSIGAILAANEVWKSWRKKRGYRMILRERRDKIDMLACEIIVDGLLQAEIDGKISRKEHNEELLRLGAVLKLNDLIPTQRRAQIVKQEIKARLNKAPKGQPPKAPITGKPQPLRVRIGTFANQFWRTKA